MTVEIVVEEPTPDPIEEPTPDVIVMEVQEPTPDHGRELGEHAARLSHHDERITAHEERIAALEQAAIAAAIVDEAILTELEAETEPEPIAEPVEVVEVESDDEPGGEHWFHKRNPFSH